MSENEISDKRSLAPQLAETIAGKPGALDHLLAQVRPYLHVLFRQMLDSDQLNRLGDSDLVQETLMRIGRSFDPDHCSIAARFRGESVPELLGWVATVAQHVAHDANDAATAAKRDHRRVAKGSKMGVMLDRGASPEQRAMRAEKAVALAAALERLPEHQREVIYLRFFEGMAFAELSERTGRSAGALRVLCSRALAKLADDELLQQQTMELE